MAKEMHKVIRACKRVIGLLHSVLHEVHARSLQIFGGCFQGGDEFCIEVINDGPTIPDTDIPHLFDPFYQGQNRRLGPVKGSGIGLSIVKDAAESIGAHVELIKNSDNQVGFRVSLPKEEDIHLA